MSPPEEYAGNARRLQRALYRRVVLTRDLPEEGLRAGDVGVIVEHYQRADVPDGYEFEVFATSGQAIVVVSVPAAASVRRRSTRS
jgi:hypothetical protein